jgi:hypothetical protein
MTPATVPVVGSTQTPNAELSGPDVVPLFGTHNYPAPELPTSQSGPHTGKKYTG